jgi:hypothetical protein
MSNYHIVRLGSILAIVAERLVESVIAMSMRWLRHEKFGA